MQRFTKKNITINLILVLAYVLWNLFIGDFRQDHILTIVLWLGAFYAHEKSRKFILAFSVFIVYWIIYDSMRIIPNYEVSTAHIREPYEIEKQLFGITLNNQLITPNEYFAIYNHKIIDFFAGIFYINWVPIPLALGVYLFLKDKYTFIKFSLAFLLVNLIGFIIYYIYPAAPPWYVDLYGFDLKIGVPGNRAGLARFDELINYPLFEGIYNKNANVLAAMPSLHSTYPLIVLFYGIQKKLGWVNIAFFVFMLGIWFTAVYSNHHYIIDVLVGVIMAILTLFGFEYLIKNKTLNSLFQKFVKQIE
jgi:hypothetical protein